MDTLQIRSCLACQWHVDFGTASLLGAARHACTEETVILAQHAKSREDEQASPAVPVSCDIARQFSDHAACGPRGARWSPIDMVEAEGA